MTTTAQPGLPATTASGASRATAAPVPVPVPDPQPGTGAGADADATGSTAPVGPADGLLPVEGLLRADHWGRSERTRRLMRQLFEPAYRYWFRAEIEGWECIPADTGVLLVANHAGVVPVDGAILMHGLERLLDRPVYALHHHGLRSTPFVGTFLARNGGVVAQRENANRLLHEEGAAVLVFPEGTKGTTKPFSQRYRLQRFGRNGFVETAMRAGVPIVPIAVVGTEETMPMVARLPVRGSAEGVPVTLNMLLFGALGGLVHFPAKVQARVLEPIELSAPPGLDRYPPADLADVGEAIRDQLQRAVDDLRSKRGSVWRG